MKLCLQLLGSPDPPTFEYPGPTVVIGRDPKCDLPLFGLANDNVSSRHARINLTRAGAFLLDLKSTNGTFLNDKRVTDGSRLKQGDFVRLGHTGPTFRVVVLDLAATPDAQDLVRPGGPRGVAKSESVLVSDSVPAGVSSTTRQLLAEVQGRLQHMSIITAAALASFLVMALVAVVLLLRNPILGSDDAKDTKGPEESSNVAKQDARGEGEPKPAPKSNKDSATAAKSESSSKDESAKDKSALVDLPKKKTESEAKNLPKKDGEPKTDSKDQKKGKETSPPVQPMARGTEIYKNILPATVWIVQGKGTTMSSGSGVLIDQERRLVLTAYHVIAKVEPNLRVFFPAFDPAGKVKNDSREYPLNKGIRAKVVLTDARSDLAVISLEDAPENITALPLAAKSVEPGERVHSIGNFGINGGVLWSYVDGSVRNVAKKKIALQNNQFVDCWIVETQSPVNPGDSGGPVVNDRGELVAVVSAYDLKTRLVSAFIDIREVHTLLKRLQLK
ncbi:MAG TPA: trypsin-like peptidase domain-containing protein [Gemmataceae bacterium]|nr:trypsin-like peptidase domain-containing protein [Gemmataceae bacterium]